MKSLERIELALTLKHSTCNCCQAVLLAYNDILKMDEKLLMGIGNGFARGMGNMEGTCGALCGAIIAIGIIKNNEKISFSYKEVLNDFKERVGDTICKKIKGLETGKILCSCDDCISNAILILDKYLAEKH